MNLIKIHKIATGISQLFTAMDKGFSKVESDITLLTRFRHICYDANFRLEEALCKLEGYLLIIAEGEPLHNRVPDSLKEEIYMELIKIKDIIHENILMIKGYIEEYSDLWKNSFSLSALQKFENLLTSEFNIFISEIESLNVQELIEKRQEIIRSTTEARIGNDR